MIAVALMILAATRVHAHAAPPAGDGSDEVEGGTATTADDVADDSMSVGDRPELDDPNAVDGSDDADDPTTTDSVSVRPELDTISDDPNAVDELALDPFGLVGTAVGDPTELREIAAHHHRLSALGRIDLSVVWRRRWRPFEPVSSDLAIDQGRPIGGLAHTDTILVLATWRK